MRKTANNKIYIDIIEGEDRRLKFSEKLAATINNGIGTFHFQVIQMFLLFFYTDVMKISPVFVAGLFLIVRIIDAFLTPAFGIVVDRITTPWGKYKPWVIGIGLGVGIFGWLTFTSFNLNPTGKLVYVVITYGIYSVFMSIGQAPGSALGPAITKRIDDRVSMGQIGYFTIMLGAIIASTGVQPLYKILGGGNDAKGFSLIMGGFAVISIIIAVFQHFTIKERYVVQTAKDKKGLSLKEMLVAVLTNKTAIIVYIYVFAINLVNGIRGAISIYYFKYYFHNEYLITISGLISLLPMAIGVALSSKITKRIGIKKNLIVASIVGVVSTAAVIVVPPSSVGVILYMVLLVILSFFSGISTPAQGTMMPAAMDYTEWKTGMNINAFMGSFQGFLQTLATALSGAIAGGSLARIGYVAGAAQQSSATIFGFKMLMSIIPALISIFTLSVAWFDLTEDRQAQITKELAERRKNAEGNVTL